MDTGATTTAARRVRFVGEPDLMGYLLEAVPGLPSDVAHVLWDGDAYLCVCLPGEIEPG